MSEEFIDETITIESIFVRHRNCHLLRGRFAPLYANYYLHLMQHGLKNDAYSDLLFKELLACFVLYMTARPWAEQHAWTVLLKQTPPLGLFVTGAPLAESATGRVITQDLRDPDQDLMYARMYQDGKEIRSSVVNLPPGSRPTTWTEEFFRASEQRLARCIELPDECFVLVTAQPDADEEWLSQLTPEQAAAIDEQEETKLLETRKYGFSCGCTLERIMPVLKTVAKDLDEFFGDQKEVEVSCPRCGAIYKVTRDMLEQFGMGN